MNAPQLPPCNYEPKPYRGPSAEVLAQRKQFMNPGIFPLQEADHGRRG